MQNLAEKSFRDFPEISYSFHRNKNENCLFIPRELLKERIKGRAGIHLTILAGTGIIFLVAGTR